MKEGGGGTTKFKVNFNVAISYNWNDKSSLVT